MLVVDLTRYLPGAFATAELLRLGARVVRVEQPGGDPMRATAPGWFDALNAGKESVVCLLPDEAAFARALLERADVVLEIVPPRCRGPARRRPGRRPGANGLLLDHGLRASAGATSSAPATTSTTSAGPGCSRTRLRRGRRCRSPTSPPARSER